MDGSELDFVRRDPSTPTSLAELGRLRDAVDRFSDETDMESTLQES